MKALSTVTGALPSSAMAVTRDQLLDALARLGEGEARDDYAAHRTIMSPTFRGYWLGALEPTTGVDAYIESFGALRSALDDYAVDVPVPPVVDDKRVVTTWVIRGRVTRDLFGVTAPGRSVVWAGCSVWTFDDDGHIVELRTYGDTRQLLSPSTPA